MKFEAETGQRTSQLEFEPDRQRVSVDGKHYEYRFTRQNGRWMLRIDTRLYAIDDVSIANRTVSFSLDGRWCEVEVRDEQDLLLDRMGFKTAEELGEGELRAPMPGKILEMNVSEGDQVTLGDPVAILEAMKMENELKAPVDGVIAAVAVQPGDSVEKNALILEIEASG